MKTIKIWWLRRQAKKHYKLATYLPDYVDCGLGMYHQLRPDIAASVGKFNELLDKLAELGEDV